MKNNPNVAGEKPKNFSSETTNAIASFDQKNAGEKNKAGAFGYSEITDIQNDLVSLKQDITNLTEHVYTDGSKKIKKFAEDKAEELENQVKEYPAQTLAVAFFSGIALSFMLGGRR